MYQERLKQLFLCALEVEIIKFAPSNTQSETVLESLIAQLKCMSGKIQSILYSVN